MPWHSITLFTKDHQVIYSQVLTHLLARPYEWGELKKNLETMNGYPIQKDKKEAPVPIAGT